MMEIPERNEDDITVGEARRAGEIVEALEADGYDTDWISSYSIIRTQSDDPYSQSGNGIMAVPSQAHKTIWQCEILGQISDGAWENYWADREMFSAWERYFEMDVIVDEELDSVELRDGAYIPEQLNYSEQLTEYDGQAPRMMFFARMVTGEEFSYEDLMAVLKDFDEMN